MEVLQVLGRVLLLHRNHLELLSGESHSDFPQHSLQVAVLLQPPGQIRGLCESLFIVRSIALEEAIEGRESNDEEKVHQKQVGPHQGVEPIIQSSFRGFDFEVVEFGEAVRAGILRKDLESIVGPESGHSRMRIQIEDFRLNEGENKKKRKNFHYI